MYISLHMAGISSRVHCITQTNGSDNPRRLLKWGGQVYETLITPTDMQVRPIPTSTMMTGKQGIGKDESLVDRKVAGEGVRRRPPMQGAWEMTQPLTRSGLAGPVGKTLLGNTRISTGPKYLSTSVEAQHDHSRLDSGLSSRRCTKLLTL